MSWRQVMKVASAQGQQLRLAAFPDIPGFDRPALRPSTPKAPDTNLAGEGVWTVQLDDVDVGVRELWLMEYRWQGDGRARGSFAIKPMQFVWVAASLALEGGILTAGPHPISPDFVLHADVLVDRFEIQTHRGLKVLRPISAAVKLDAHLQDLSAAQLYFPGLEATGNGVLHADLRIIAGNLAAPTTVDLELTRAVVRTEDATYRGHATAHASIDPDSSKPTARLALGGTFTTGLEKRPLICELGGLNAQLTLTTADLAEGPGLAQLRAQLRAQLKEVRVEDARAIKNAAGAKVPIILPLVLGNGPLVAAGAAFVTPEQTLVRIQKAELGGATVRGAMARGDNGWNGAFAGRFGAVDIGLRLKRGILESQPLIAEGWLEAELTRAGITPWQVNDRD